MATLPLSRSDTTGNTHAPRHGRWLSVVSHLDPMYGGLSAAVPELGAAVNRSGEISSGLAAFCAPGEEIPSRAAELALDGLLISRWPMGRKQWLTEESLRLQFLETVDAVDGVHLHGLWEQSTLMGARSARARNKPYIVSAHGMLERWALRNKRLKKQIYSALIERGNLRRASCLHALTRAEADDYRRYGTQVPIAIIPNGVQVPPTVNGDLFHAQYPALKGKRIVLFLGRIHFKKGLDLLAKAWKEVASQWPDAQLVLAGPDSEGTRAQVETLLHQLEVADRVSFTGMLDERMKWSALAAAECFVLPSYSEGLSVSTLEAMGTGLPVIITEHCNLPEVSQFHAGWVVPSRVPELTGALQKFLGNTPEQNRRIGGNGKRLVQDRYTWTAVGGQMAELYSWVLGGPTPTSFELRGA